MRIRQNYIINKGRRRWPTRHIVESKEQSLELCSIQREPSSHSASSSDLLFSSLDLYSLSTTLISSAHDQYYLWIKSTVKPFYYVLWSIGLFLSFYYTAGELFLACLSNLSFIFLKHLQANMWRCFLYFKRRHQGMCGIGIIKTIYAFPLKSWVKIHAFNIPVTFHI